MASNLLAMASNLVAMIHFSFLSWSHFFGVACGAQNDRTSHTKPHEHMNGPLNSKMSSNVLASSSDALCY